MPSGAYSYSSVRDDPKAKLLCLMKQKNVRICLIIFVVIVILLAVILGVALTRKSSGSSTECPEPSPKHVDGGSVALSNCGMPLNFHDQCNLQWERISQNSTNWLEARFQYLPADVECCPSTIIISPLYKASPEACSIKIMLNFSAITSYQVYIYSSNTGPLAMNMTSEICRHGIITDQPMIRQLSSFHVVVVTDAVLAPDEVGYGSVTSHDCAQFATIEFPERTISNPAYARVSKGVRNLCTMEPQKNRNVNCDWLEVVEQGFDRFRRQQYHACIYNGIPTPENEAAVWFLTLSANGNDSKGLLISPILEGGTSHALLSFWYRAVCNGSYLRFYTLRDAHDVDRVLSGSLSPVNELQLSFKTQKWVYEVTEIPLSPDWLSYQIVIEVFSKGNCTELQCREDTEEKNVFFALDEIAVETRFQSCHIREDISNSSILDCSFETSQGGITNCVWNSSKHPSVPDHLPPEQVNEYLDWQVDSRPNTDGVGRGAEKKHFEGRVNIVTYEGIRAKNNYYRSPLLVSNEECSCHMSFLYLLRGGHAPTLQVSIVVSNDNAQHSDNTTLLPQWSGRLTDDNWQTADVLLNVPASRPFYVQFRALYFIDLKAEVSIDDVSSNCDFQLFTS